MVVVDFQMGRRRDDCGSQREGLLDGFSLVSYLLLVDDTSRLCRQGKARVSREVASMLARQRGVHTIDNLAASTV